MIPRPVLGTWPRGSGLVRGLLPALAVSITIAIAVGTTFSPAEALDTLYLVRHAEKLEGWPEDHALAAMQPLSRAGTERAARLAEWAAEQPLRAVYASPTTRSIATALAAAKAAYCPLIVDERTVDRDQIAGLLEELQGKHPGPGAVLVVAHSNTIPWYLLERGAQPSCFDELGISEYEHGLRISGYEGLWELRLDSGGCATLRRRPGPGGE